MDKVKLSTLPKETVVLVKGDSTISTVEDILNDIEYYKGRTVYTTTSCPATFNAKSIIDNAIEDECQNMYEDWDECITEDVTEEDIKEIQKIFDSILSRSPSQNISYSEDKLIEFDI